MGTEVSWWGKQIAQPYCQTVEVIPRGDSPEYLTALNSVIDKYNAELVFVNTEPELEALVEHRDTFQVELSCPGNWFASLFE